DYLFGLKQEYESYQFCQKKIAECDVQINKFLKEQINTDPSKKNFSPQPKHIKGKTKMPSRALTSIKLLTSILKGWI
ncbi:MAG: hypothetical protein M3342_15950, partial [Bacteroidota bacterium]|nr:hypothetical protein [Bacteroidota bacterium]